MFKPQKGFGRGTKDVRFALDPALWTRAEQMAEKEGIEVQEVMRQALLFALDNTTPRDRTWAEAWEESGPILLNRACTTLARIALSGGAEHPFHIGSNPLPRYEWSRSQLVGAVPVGIRTLGYPWPSIVGGMVKAGARFDEVIPAVWNAMQKDAEPERLGSLAAELMSALFLELAEGEEPEAAAVFARTLPVELVSQVAKQLESLHWGGQERSMQWARLLEEALTKTCPPGGEGTESLGR